MYVADDQDRLTRLDWQNAGLEAKTNVLPHEYPAGAGVAGLYWLDRAPCAEGEMFLAGYFPHH